MLKMNTHITKFVLAVTVPGLGRYQRKSVTTCDFAVPSALNGCARHTHKVTLATALVGGQREKRRDADQNAPRICRRSPQTDCLFI